jgi:hypothetical protein
VTGEPSGGSESAAAADGVEHENTPNSIDQIANSDKQIDCLQYSAEVCASYGADPRRLWLYRNSKPRVVRIVGDGSWD